MKKQTYFVFGILIGVLMIMCLSFVPVYGAEYGNNDSAFSEIEDQESTEKFTSEEEAKEETMNYYYIVLSNENAYCKIKCMGYRFKGNTIIIMDIFKTDDCGIGESSEIIAPKKLIFAIAKKSETKKDATGDDCFIGTAQGDMPLQVKIPITILLLLGLMIGLRKIFKERVKWLNT